MTTTDPVTTPGTHTAAVRVAGLAFVFVGVLVAGVYWRAGCDGERRRHPDALAHLLDAQYTGEDRLAPDFALPDRTGHVHRLSDLRGRTVVLHFWSRTCGPCVDELQRSLPAFDELLRDRRDVAALLVTVDANDAAIAPLVPPGFTLPIVFDPTRRVVSGMYGTQLFPETWVIDPHGVIRARFDHTLDWSSGLFLEYLGSFR